MEPGAPFFALSPQQQISWEDANRHRRTLAGLGVSLEMV